jgi:hypothetical protein
MENWKKVPNFNKYEASDLGNIRRINGKVLKQINNGTNYMCVCLCENGKAKRLYVHRIVAWTFLNELELPEVNHIDGNRQNNSLSNLEWVTRSENHIHRYNVLKREATNKGKFGALNWNSKKVGMYNLNGDLIKIYAAVMEAARDLKINDGSIRSVIYGKSKTCKGHKFKYI